ncbi:MAG: tetratricopeptide repeat protein [Anaerolineales bacterium]|nr:tetratricopeptide repeat protein [Anaerolineales bacterium]
MLALLQTAVLVPPLIPEIADLMRQCFFWVEAKGHYRPWREIMESVVAQLPPEDKLEFYLLKQLGQLYRLEQNYEAACGTLEKARFLAEKQQDQQFVAEIVVNQAHVYWQQNDMQNASLSAKDALNLLAGQQNRTAGVAHQIIAEAARVAGEFETAVQHLHQAQDIFQHSPNPTDLTRIMNSLAVTYQQMGAYETALTIFPQILKKLANSVYERDRIEASLNWGHLLYEMEQFQNAQKIFSEVIQHIHHQDGYKSFQAMAHNSLACTLRELGYFSQAEAHFDQSRILYEALPDHRLLANTLGGLAMLYERQGLWEKTAVFLAKAIQLLDRITNDPWSANLKKTYQTKQQEIENGNLHKSTRSLNIS